MSIISIVVPVYNMKPYIEHCLESLIHQTYKDFEIIIVDDGSNDGSEDICNKFAGKYENISVIHKKNGGLSTARNVGIEHASGKYIVFPDPDDWVEPDYLETFVKLLNDYPTSLACVGHYITDEQGARRHINCDKILVFKGNEALTALMQSKYYCGFSSTKLYEMDIIRSNKLYFDPELGMAQDLHFTFRYIEIVGSVVYDTKPVYHYYQLSGGVTTSGLSPRRISGLKTYEKIYDMAKDKYPEAAIMARCTLANLSLALVDKYYIGKTKDRELLMLLKTNIRKNVSYFLKSQYSVIRKSEMIIASVSTVNYYVLRKIFNRIHSQMNDY